MPTTTVFGLTKPSAGATGWDVPVNADLDTIDSLIAGSILDNGFRLTTVASTPVPTTDQAAVGIIRFSPMKSKYIFLYTAGGLWEVLSSNEVSLALTATSGKNYDVFVYDAAAVLTLELSAAWTDDTTRADAITQQNGVWVKSGATTRRLVGTIRASGANVIDDTAAKRYLWNVDNRVRRNLAAALETADSYAYTTATLRQANANTANQLDYVCGLAEDEVEAEVFANYQNTIAGTAVLSGVGVDSTTVNSAQVFGIMGLSPVASQKFTSQAKYRGIPGIGRHYLPWLEYSTAAGTTTWYGDNGTPTTMQSRIVGYCMA